MKATAKAPANIALIKYWGKKDEKLRLPLNSSISMNLSNCYTVATVEFSKRFQKDFVGISSVEAKKLPTHRPFGHAVGKDGKEEKRVITHLERIRKLAKSNLKAKVVSKNSFPQSAGIASSASGFAALTLAATKAVGLDLSEKEFSILARLGSGSACRSIPDGFVEWKKGKTSKDSFAYSLYPPNYWDLRDIIVIVQKKEKKIGSSSGMKNVKTSPFFKARLASINGRIRKIKQALKEKDFKLLGETIEEEAINMHCVIMTQKPALFYWNSVTIEIIKAVQKWREKYLSVYFTIDAGSSIHLICQAKDEKEVVKRINQLNGVLDVIINKPARGAHIINKHLWLKK